MSRPRRSAARGCRGKRAHISSSGAQRQAETLIAAGACPDGINIYRCRHCRLWHVGHVPGRTKWRA